MTFVFNSKNTSVSIILDSVSEEYAWEELNDLIKEDMNDFRLSEVLNEEDE